MSTKTLQPTAEVPVSTAWTDRPVKVVAASRGLIWFFGFFFLSGFCSILYELIWLRLTMAQFGVTTPMVSIVLSTFMAGLGLGSWVAGRAIRKLTQRFTAPPLHYYAVTEILIGGSAALVPLELRAGRWILEHLGSSLSWSSGEYYIAAGIWLAFTLVPWCACMGATIPLGMFAIRSNKRLESTRSFSFLYLANVLGAVVGALLPLALIELWGFSGTLQFGMGMNLLICFSAMWLANKRVATTATQSAPELESTTPSLRELAGDSDLWLLFATGLTSMGMEVVWTRHFTIFVGTMVYAFASILAIYLASTFLGSVIYRWWSRRHSAASPILWPLLFLSSLLPLLATDVRFRLNGWTRVSLAIALFSGLLGFLTPQLVDRFSNGDPNRAGVGYAVNVVGCILGPLLAGFLLLPYFDERYAFVILAAPWLAVSLWHTFPGRAQRAKGIRAGFIVATILIFASSFAIVRYTMSYTQLIGRGQLRRDSTATVIAAGHGMNKHLFVNGISMTGLTPITKIMSAMPLAHLDHAPQNALVICFGMGTTHRSMLSWGIDSTAIDLVPSVPQFFGYFHSDAAQLIASPHSHIVIDDGRRFLERTTGQYDVIVIDPPPPVEAAGTSLLYSREFYVAAKKRLKTGGILQQWSAGGDKATVAAEARALKDEFPYVRVFQSVYGWGYHFLASLQPIPYRSAEELAKRMPPAAAADLVEWGPNDTPEQQFAAMLKNEVPVDTPISASPETPPMEDNRPINEYWLLRTWFKANH